MKLLDLYCKAGGAAKGYAEAGFEVLGVDIEPQPNYPFEFIQTGALEFMDAEGWRGFDVIHASPPCQAFSVLQRRTGKTYPELIAPTRERLVATGKPYVIENVVGAPLRNPIKLCGSMFGLPIERHRLFESNVDLIQPQCDHARQRALWPDGFPALRSGREGKRARVVGIYGTGGGDAKDLELWKWAMGIDWMTKAEIAEAIPPAYTYYIGRQL